MITAEMQLELETGRFRTCFHRGNVEACLSLSTASRRLQPPLVRVHSACMFGESLGAVDCDCGPQLRTSLAAISRSGYGAVVYLFQEGRGIGLEEKIRALGLQREDGLTTYEAFTKLGYSADERTYASAGVALADLGLDRSSIDLISNNLVKCEGLRTAGIPVGKMRSIPIDVDRRALSYLQSKEASGMHRMPWCDISFFNGSSAGASVNRD